MIKIPELGRFCFCSLETGVVVTGTLTLIATAAGLVMAVLAASSDDVDRQRPSGPFDFSISLLVYAAIVNATASILVIIGVLTKHAVLLIPWLIIDLLVAVGFKIAGIVIFVSSSRKQRPNANYLAGALIGVPVFLYFWWATLSLYGQLKERERTRLLRTQGK